MALANWISFLEVPNILQEEGLFLHFIFIADDVSHIRRRNPQHFVADVRDQFTTFGGSGNIDCVFVPDLVVLALCRNAPGTQTCDFSSGIEVNVHSAMLSTFGPQNFVSLAYVGSDFVG